MRRCLVVFFLLLLAPVSGQWVPQNFSERDGEWVVVNQDGWIYEDWVELRNDGLEPLRQLSRTDLLVWGTHGDFQLDQDVLLRGPIAEGYRVVLEPRLPSNIQWDILSSFIFENLQLADEGSSLPTSFDVQGVDPSIFDLIPGVWWVEPLLETSGRNELASSIMEHGSTTGHPAWDVGLNGSGVIIGVADSGIELDHGCFRDSGATVGEIGINHRKVVLVNTSIGDGDLSGQADYRHGTHIAGTLVCEMWDGNITNGTSPSHGARVLFQDVVNESGWSEPTVDWLLAEALGVGAVIHSDSWGDATEAYTLRSAEFDLWHREVPWSLAFIAPGNNPSKFYEPANARNVVSVGGALHDNSSNLYSSSSHGPSEEGLRGNFIVAPAMGIVSAAADGNISSFNDDMRSSTGTSMSTPLGASITAVIQQAVQDGWFTNGSGGFVPSGSLLRSLLALSSESMYGGQQGGENVGPAPDSLQGWGRPDLANLIDFQNNTSRNIWIHDSYMMDEIQRLELVNEWLMGDGSRPLEQMIGSRWNGSGAAGPFLKQGDVFSWNLSLVPGNDLDVFLSFNQRPFGSVSDDLDLILRLPNGVVVSSNESLEGTENLRVNASELVGFENITIEVYAKLVGVGNHTDVLGSDGDMVGFSLAVRGVSGEYVGPEPEPVVCTTDLCWDGSSRDPINCSCPEEP
ncbi:MAG: S8 family serine peptidase, partial [Candidatus Thalassarchaeaceae archaeon]|nr:S8 family serine peptidase [Candidatus Thalassarchaeaceae archaeon]